MIRTMSISSYLLPTVFCAVATNINPCYVQGLYMLLTCHNHRDYFLNTDTKNSKVISILNIAIIQRVREAGMQGRIQLPATSTHYDHGAQPRSKVFDFFLREENRIVLKTLVEQQRTNAQLNSHYMAPTWNRTGVTLVRGERFTHKPTVPLNYVCVCINLLSFVFNFNFY